MTLHDTIARIDEFCARWNAAVDDEAETSLRRWLPSPGELVSLWDMLRFNAQPFVMLVSLLKRVEFSLENLESILFQHGSQVVEQARQILAVGTNAPENKQIREDSQQVWTQTCSNWKSILDALEGHCIQPNLTSGKAQIQRIRQEIVRSTELRDFGKWVEFRNSFKELSQRVEDELSNRFFLFLPPGQDRFYEEEYPFGDDVASKFPELVEDIAEASKCLGLNRYTAAVFHLMRTLEIIVQTFAQRLNTTINIDQPWGDILNKIDVEIARLSGNRNATTAEREWKALCSEVAVFLRHVKDAWRNPTMHPKRTYTEEEAKRVFEVVKAFTQNFAKL